MILLFKLASALVYVVLFEGSPFIFYWHACKYNPLFLIFRGATGHATSNIISQLSQISLAHTSIFYTAAKPIGVLCSYLHMPIIYNSLAQIYIN